jgi:hypothetical protein
LAAFAQEAAHKTRFSFGKRTSRQDLPRETAGLALISQSGALRITIAGMADRKC